MMMGVKGLLKEELDFKTSNATSKFDVGCSVFPPSLWFMVKRPEMPIHPAGKGRTCLIPTVLRKLSCHVLVTHPFEMSPARHMALKNLL
jgi:hypothetical protein